MPLVRFPLVSLLRPSAALKRLQQGNAVVAQLIKEALALQVKPASAVATFVPTRHRLIEGVLPDDTDDVPRAKRRKYCKDDKVAAVDPAPRRSSPLPFERCKVAAVLYHHVPQI